MTALCHQPHPTQHAPSKLPRRHTRGVTLIELMIALGFGLVLILATLSIYMANKQTFRQVENLSRLNENARIAFDFLGRDFREAGATPCGNNLISNILNDQNAINFGGSQKGVTPYGKTQALPSKNFGTKTAERVISTDAVILSSANSDNGVFVKTQNEAAASLKLNKIESDFEDGEIVLACNQNFATIFQITGVQSSNLTLIHNTGNSQSTGNCTKVLYRPGEIINCTSSNGAPIDGATIVKTSTISWYIGHNGRGGKSLYRISRSTNTPEEMVENVTNMEIEYLVADAIKSEPFDYVISTNYATTAPKPKGNTSGASYSWWPTNFRLAAARITLTLQTQESVGTDSRPIVRKLTTVFSLRNQIY